jgi:O-antigen/teichoic acid export membrane protein
LLGALFIVGTAVAALALRLDVGLFVAVVSLVAYGAVRSGSTSLEAYFRSRRMLRRVVAALLIEKGVLLLLIALVVGAGFGLVGVALAYPIAGLARVLVNAVNIIGRKEIIVSQTRLGDVRHVLSGSFPFALNRASLNVVPQLDTFVLAVFSPTGAGYFALGNRILGPIQIVPFVFSSTLYPFLARESKESRAGWTAVVLLGVGGLFVAGIGIAVAPFLVPYIFGSEYRNAVPVVQVMLVALPFIFAANSLLVHVYSSRREGRGLTVLLAAISVTGTVAIVTGQILIGPLAAAGGYVLRHALFTGTLAVAGSLPGRPAPGSLAESNGIRELSHAATRSAP